MSAWSHLPNAAHIDWVLVTAQMHPELWTTAWNLAQDATKDASRPLIADENRIEAWNSARDIARVIIGNANTAWYSTMILANRYAISHPVWDAIIVLIGYDDCEQYLSMSSEELQAWALVTQHPAAVFLLCMVIVRDRIKDLESV
jgi:hypothetical protein